MLFYHYGSATRNNFYKYGIYLLQKFFHVSSRAFLLQWHGANFPYRSQVLKERCAAKIVEFVQRYVESAVSPYI